MKPWIRLVSFAAIALAPPSGSIASAEGLIPGQTLPRGLAVDIATRAVEVCAARGYAVSVSIADPAGNIRHTISADGVSALSIEVARRKAHSAAILRASTSATENAVRAAPGYGAMLNGVDPGLLLLAGGVPIMAKSTLAGAIGVGGAPGGDKDEACALAALAAFAKQLE